MTVEAEVAEAVRFCRDCRHASPAPRHPLEVFGKDPSRAWRLARCMHPAARHPEVGADRDHLVIGVETPPDPATQYLCWSERGDERDGHCGRSGRLWEPV